MTTLGKISAVLILVFALVLGGIIVYDFTTRTNWKRAYDQVKLELDASHSASQASAKANKELLAKLKQSDANLDGRQIRSSSKELELMTALNTEKKNADAQKAIADMASLNLQKAIAEKNLQGGEIKQLTEAVKKREDTILALQKLEQELRTAALKAEGDAKTAIARSQQLLKLLQEKEIKLAAYQSGTGAGSGGGVAAATNLRDSNYSNPPPDYVKGIIEEIHPKERDLVKLSVGSDAGVKVDHTLEVYRLSPQPAYLGRVRILEATPHNAVGRMIPTPGQTRPGPLQVGDEVASKLQMR